MMLQARRFNYFLYRRVRRLQFEVDRYVRIQAPILLPRGGQRRQQESQQKEEEDGQWWSVEEPESNEISYQPKKEAKPKTIDSVDPIVLKYTNLLNDMNNVAAGKEKVNLTNFGSIRFDNENVPTVHGEFDQEFRPSVSDLIDARVPGFGKNTEGLESVTDAKSLADGDWEGPFSPQVASMQSFEDLEDRGHSEVSQSGRLHDDKNYPSNLSNSSASFTQKNNVMENIMKKEDNAKDYKTQEQPIFTAQSPLEPEVLDREVYNSRNLGYFDEVFFKDNLDTLYENQKPIVEYSKIKDDIEKSLLLDASATRQESSSKMTKQQDVEKFDTTPDKITSKEIIDDTGENQLRHRDHRESNKSKSQEEKNKAAAAPSPKTAYDYVVQRRREEHDEKYGIKAPPGDPSRSTYRKILSLVNEKSKDRHTDAEILKLLKCSILYNQHDIVGLYKSYGLTMHGGTESQHPVLTNYLPDLAHFLKVPQLFPVHRLDANTTGVVLFATTQNMADTLRDMIKKRKLKKTYVAITRGVPSPMHGILDIPIAEGSVEGRHRMVLKPDIPGLHSTSNPSKEAVTKFKVQSRCNSAALVELNPLTGVKHQLRVHLAFGLSCPVLGDHKYSHLKKMAPQRLPGDMLDQLSIKQSKVRELPLFLHSQAVVVPELVGGHNVSIKARLPAFFNKAIDLLKLDKKKNHVRYDHLRLID